MQPADAFRDHHERLQEAEMEAAAPEAPGRPQKRSTSLISLQAAGTHSPCQAGVRSPVCVCVCVAVCTCGLLVCVDGSGVTGAK